MENITSLFRNIKNFFVILLKQEFISIPFVLREREFIGKVKFLRFNRIFTIND